MGSAPDERLDAVNKRFTLNLLIQGAATHTFLTAHHLVREELDGLDGKLIPRYDKIALCVILGYWYGDVVLVCGRPSRFWKRVRRPDHPFCRHPLLAEHGAALAEASRRHGVARARRKGVCVTPFLHTAQAMWLVLRTMPREKQHKARLEALARRATHLIWGIEEERLDAELTAEVEFGAVRTPATRMGRMIRAAAAGYGGVVRAGTQFRVMARAWVWPLLAHELTKGTAELVCLCGLNTLDRQTYDHVVDVADRIEWETWLMQAGSELWRRLLAVLPDDRPLPEALMQVARLEPQPLHELMGAVIAAPDRAAGWIAEL